MDSGSPPLPDDELIPVELDLLKSEPLEPQPVPEPVEPEPDWKVFEKAVAHIEESYDNCKVTRNHKLKGRRSDTERQIDVWLEAEIGDRHVVTVAIECRRYTDRPVSIKDIDAFVGFLEDVGADKGVMISHSGYTDGARKRAAGANIELRMLTIEEAEEFDWEDFLRDSCRVPECFGTIRWHFSDHNSEAGRCSSCGSFHIRCGNCGSVDWYEESGMPNCWCGDMKWRLHKEKGEICAIEEISPKEESQDNEDEQEEEAPK
jgi:hypothetical protein